tara:strand:+ start:415 stop:795 length:381 start_codon:yes stop_codon:yes gene_type:complete
MLNRIFKPILLVGLALVFFSTFTSCKKEKETIGVIIVKYSNGNLVQGANVRLHQDGQISTGGEPVDPGLATGWQETDASGRVEFTFDLEAILNVDVVDTVGNDTYAGSDVIRLLKGKTVTKVVEIN